MDDHSNLEVEGAFLVVDKPKGLTSHDVVKFLRHITKIKRIGHTGTLDPAASGVLVVAIGPSTKLIQFLPEEDKEYQVMIRFGIATDTYDSEGKVTISREVPSFSQDEIRRICQDFEGETEQYPPSFSAIKIDGKKSYDLARAGKKVVLKSRNIKIFQFQVEDYHEPVLNAKVVCSRGTYVRALAHDLGMKLGCGAHLAGLRRLRSGWFSLDKAVAFKEIPILYQENCFKDRILRPDEPLFSMMAVYLNQGELVRFSHGGSIPLAKLGASWQSFVSENTRVYDSNGQFCGIGYIDSAVTEMKPICILRGAN